MKATDKCIASVLNVILKILEEASVDIAKEAQEIHVFALIREILSSGQANLGLFTLKVLLDHSISMPLLEYEVGRDRFNFTSNFDGVIYNENCLGLILGMFSHEMSLITIFVHKHFRQKCHHKFDIFQEKSQQPLILVHIWYRKAKLL